MRTERFLKTFDVLTRAYFDGTLAAGHCAACAVGNMVAAASGFDVKGCMEDGGRVLPLHTPISGWYSAIRRCNGSEEEAIQLLELNLGYSLSELREIERMFEKSSRCKLHSSMSSLTQEYTEEEILGDQYIALTAVINFLLFLDGQLDDDREFATKLIHPKQKAECVV